MTQFNWKETWNYNTLDCDALAVELDGVAYRLELENYYDERGLRVKYMMRSLSPSLHQVSKVKIFEPDYSSNGFNEFGWRYCETDNQDELKKVKAEAIRWAESVISSDYSPPV
jgi:hypothetical protein